MGDNKFFVSEVVSALAKITEHKLNYTNYLEWSKTIRVYLHNIDKDNYLAKKLCTVLYVIRNSIDSDVIDLINHCGFIKKLMNYIEFLYLDK